MVSMKKRVLSLILTVAMVLSLLPMQVFADVNVGEEQISHIESLEISTDSNAQIDNTEPEELPAVFSSLYTGDRPDYYFANAEELAEKLADAEEDDVFFYDGSNPFSLSVDLEIPEGVRVNCVDYDVVVEDDAELIVNGWLYCDNLQVIGSMTAADWINVEESVTVNNGGSLILNRGMGLGNNLNVHGKLDVLDNNIAMSYPMQIIGLDRITFHEEWQCVQIEDYASDLEEMKDIVAAMSESLYHNDRVQYRIWLEGDSETDIFEINENFAIEDWMHVYFTNVKQVEIAEDVVLYNHGELNIWVPMALNGILVNSGRIDVNNQAENEDRMEFNGTISLGENAEYTGEGEFGIHVDDTVEGLEEVLIGFNLKDMFFRPGIGDDGMIHYWLDQGSYGDDGSSVGRGVANFDELEAFIEANGSSSESFWIYYNGTEAFEIKRNLSIPANMEFECPAELIIPENVTLTTERWFSSNGLSVKGTLNAKEHFQIRGDVEIDGIVNAHSAFYCQGDLAVDGELHVYDQTLSIEYPQTVSGMENIYFKQEWQKLNYNVLVNNADELEDMVEIFAKTSDDDQIHYNIQFPGNDNNKMDFVLDRDITIPSNTELNLYSVARFEVKSGTTLTNNGTMYVPNPLVVNGALVNNNEINVNHRKNNNSQGTVTLGSGSSYSGEGIFWVNGDDQLASLSSVLFGFDLDDFDVEKYNNASNVNWRLSYAAGKTKLGTPINLGWGTEYREQWKWDEATDTHTIVGYDVIPKAGFISWETVRPDQARASIRIYEDGNPNAVVNGEWGFNVEQQPIYRSVDEFLVEDLPTGSYYFTVQSLADNKEYRNSDVADSRYNADGSVNPDGIYHYVRPNAELDVVTNLHWEDRNDNFFRWAEWDENNSATQYIDGYWVLYYFSETLDGEYRQVSGSRGRYEQDPAEPFHDDMFERNGVGYYKFKVKVLSNDIEKMCNSDWSDFSPVLNVTQISNDVNSDLDDIIADVQNGTVNKEDVLDSVQSMDRNDLIGALIADEDKSGTTQKIEELEDLVLDGQKTPITVNNAAAAFNPSDITIVGANLNNKANDTNNLIELVVDKPKEDHVIPERYNSAVSVSFSMTLDNVEDPKNLDVPVKITLPIPASINPKFLVVFHYHVDGGYDVIKPHVYKEGGKWYADFVLTSFSDFIMTSTHELTKVEAKAATTTAEGNIEYYTCECCDSLFADSEAKKEITLADTIIPKKSSGGGSSSGGSSSSGGGGGSSSSSKNAQQSKPVNTAVLPEYVTTGTWKLENGKWMFTDKSGLAYVNKWAAVANPYANVDAGQAPFDWFYFDANGHMAASWVLDNGLWYYLNPASDGTQGAMLIGWQFIEGKWYYFNPISDGTKGSMLVNTWIDSYYVDENGVWDETKTR